MKIFEDITIKWDGREHTIPSEKVMRAIGLIEEHLTMKEIGEAVHSSGGIAFTKVAAAYGAILRFAGADITDEQVYAGLFSMSKEKNNVQAVLNGLLAMMIPPSAYKDAAKKAVEDAVSSGKAKPIAVNSSKPRTRQRSATSG